MGMRSDGRQMRHLGDFIVEHKQSELGLKPKQWAVVLCCSQAGGVGGCCMFFVPPRVQGCKLTDFSVSAVRSHFARFAVGEWWCVVFNNSLGRGLLLRVL